MRPRSRRPPGPPYSGTHPHEPPLLPCSPQAQSRGRRWGRPGAAAASRSRRRRRPAQPPPVAAPARQTGATAAAVEELAAPPAVPAVPAVPAAAMAAGKGLAPPVAGRDGAAGAAPAGAAASPPAAADQRLVPPPPLVKAAAAPAPRPLLLLSVAARAGPLTTPKSWLGLQLALQLAPPEWRLGRGQSEPLPLLRRPSHPLEGPGSGCAWQAVRPVLLAGAGAMLRVWALTAAQLAGALRQPQ